MTNLEKAAEILNGRIYRRRGNYRVYLNPNRIYATAYIDYDEELNSGEWDAAFEWFGGGRLVVCVDSVGHSDAWCRDAAKKIKHRLALHIAEKLNGKFSVVEDWRDIVL